MISTKNFLMNQLSIICMDNLISLECLLINYSKLKMITIVSNIDFIYELYENFKEIYNSLIWWESINNY